MGGSFWAGIYFSRHLLQDTCELEKHKKLFKYSVNVSCGNTIHYNFLLES